MSDCSENLGRKTGRPSLGFVPRVVFTTVEGARRNSRRYNVSAEIRVGPRVKRLKSDERNVERVPNMNWSRKGPQIPKEIETCADLVRKCDGERAKVFSCLQTVNSAAKLIGSGNSELTQECMAKILCNTLEYLVGYFPNESGEPTRRVHVGGEGFALSPGQLLSEYETWLGKETSHGQTRASELLLTSLCERYSQQQLVDGTMHPRLGMVRNHNAETAFTELYKIYDAKKSNGQPAPMSLTSCLAKKLKNSADREDVANEAWAGVFDSCFHITKGKRFAGLTSFRSFLFGIALIKRNKLLEKQYGEREKQAEFISEVTPEKLSTIDDASFDLLNDYTPELVREGLRELIERGEELPFGILQDAFNRKEEDELLADLNQRQKFIARLKYFRVNDATQRTFENVEIAELYGCSPAWVAQLLNGYVSNRGRFYPGIKELLLIKVKIKLGILD